MPADILLWVDMLKNGGVVLALLLALVGGWRGWYVWSDTYKAITDEKDEAYEAMVQDRNLWRDKALQATDKLIEAVSRIQNAARIKRGGNS